MYCDCMKVKFFIIVEIAKCVHVKFLFAHLGNVMELGIVKFEMAGRTRGGRSERNEELETVREELREVRRELRETVELMRGQGSRRSGGTQGHED